MIEHESGERPQALELLEAAREALLGDVLPGLSGNARYQALMVASALAMAVRELAAGDRAVARELELLDLLYGDDEPPRADEAAGARRSRLNRRLARDLRSGVLDGGPQLGVRRLLRERLEASLAISNPRRLRTPKP